MEKAKFHLCKFFVTYRCNSRCIYCNFWSDEKYKDTPEMSLEDAKYTVNQLREIGVRYIDFTGGEPILYPHLIELIKYTKSLGIVTECTTNAIAFQKYLDEIIPYVDNFNISLDTLDRERYIYNRGVDTIDRTITLIKDLQARNKSAKIIAVVTDETISEVSELVKFAQENRIPIYLSPLFKYFKAGKDEPTRNTIEELEKLFYEPFSIINLHFIKLFSGYNIERKAECDASRRIITIAPDGKIIAPCMYNDRLYIAWRGRIADSLQSEEFQFYQSQAVKGHKCKDCTATPYLGLSFSYHFNKIFLFQAFTEEYLKFKSMFLDKHFPRITPEAQKLIGDYQELKELIEDLPETQLSPLLYKTEKKGTVFLFKLWKYPISLEEYIYDSLHEYCWDIECSPHRVVKYFYNEILPILTEFYNQNLILERDYFDILNRTPLFQLDWWKLFMARYFKTQKPIDASKLSRRVAGFLQQVLEKLPEHEPSDRVRELIFVASIMAGLPPLKRPNLRFFKEETLALKFLLLNKEEYQWQACQDWFSQEIQMVIRNQTVLKKEVAVLGDPVPVPYEADALRLNDEAFQMLPYDKDRFYHLLEVLRSSDEEQVEEFIVRIKGQLSLEEIIILKDWLLEYQYFVRSDLKIQKVAPHD